MKAAAACCYLVLVAACGYHDTPVASYRAPLPDSAGGAAGAAGAAGVGIDLGGGVSVSAAGDASGGAGAPGLPSCIITYPTIPPDGLTSHYKVVTTGQPWVEAERNCEADGAHLIVIDDDAENTWMASIAAQALTNDKSTHQLAWLGAGDQATEGDFQWVTGGPLTVPRWADKEPNSLNGFEDCVEIRANGQWNDDRCNARLAYVCECDLVPSAAQWCDTDAAASCGDCSSSCSPEQTCNQQQCL